jgi:hypothetical protein
VGEGCLQGGVRFMRRTGGRKMRRFFMRKIILMGVMGLVMAGSGFAKTNGGLILSGLDTMNYSAEKGFDFVTQEKCSLSADYSPSYPCFKHFYLNAFEDPFLHYDLRVPNGYSVKSGKVNLDSLKNAPSDSIFSSNYNVKHLIDSIPPDSLSSRIGNVYVLKTGNDPRDGYPYHAKIKILKFIVLDSMSHSVKMIFLWAVNLTGYKDLTTQSLDTFHLDSTPTHTHDNPLSATLATRPLTPTVFKVATGKFFIPLALQGTNAFLSIYDLSGKKLGRVSAGNSRVIDLRQFGVGRGVVVVRVER